MRPAVDPQTATLLSQPSASPGASPGGAGTQGPGFPTIPIAFAAQGFANLGGAISQGIAYSAQAAYAKRMDELNARLADFNSADAIRRGEQEAGRVELKAKQITASQRVALAAQGIALDTGNAAQLTSDTRMLADIDVMQTRVNAYREAFGYQVQALDFAQKGEFADMAGEASMRNSLITGAASSLGDFGKAAYYWKKGGY